MEQTEELERKVDAILVQRGLMIAQELLAHYENKCQEAKQSAEQTKMKIDCVIAKADPSKKDEVTQRATEQIDQAHPKAKELALELKGEPPRKGNFPTSITPMPHPPKKPERKTP